MLKILSFIVILLHISIVKSRFSHVSIQSRTSRLGRHIAAIILPLSWFSAIPTTVNAITDEIVEVAPTVKGMEFTIYRSSKRS